MDTLDLEITLIKGLEEDRNTWYLKQGDISCYYSTYTKDKLSSVQYSDSNSGESESE